MHIVDCDLGTLDIKKPRRVQGVCVCVSPPRRPSLSLFVVFPHMPARASIITLPPSRDLGTNDIAELSDVMRSLVRHRRRLIRDRR